MVPTPLTCAGWLSGSPAGRQVWAGTLYWEATLGRRPSPDRIDKLVLDVDLICQEDPDLGLLDAVRRAL
jgi:hypothetical protein